MIRSATLTLSVVTLLMIGCASASDDAGDGEGAFSSNQATLLEFDFDAEVVTDSSWNDKQTIQDQLLYTMGHLNADHSVGRLDNVVLSAPGDPSKPPVRTQDGGRTTIKYHAKLPVAWGSKTNLPTSYEFKLPRDISYAGQQAFTEKHKENCVDWSAHEVDVGSMWYYYRPRAEGCEIADSEVVKFTAKVVKSTNNTAGMYPEYHKVWEDDRLEVVAIFGKYEATGQAGDAGVTGFNSFVAQMKRELGAMRLVTTPANIGE